MGRPYPPEKVTGPIKATEHTTSTLHLNQSIGWPFGPPSAKKAASGDVPPGVTTLTAKVEMPDSAPKGVFVIHIEVDDGEIDRIGIHHRYIIET